MPKRFILVVTMSIIFLIAGTGTAMAIRSWLAADVILPGVTIAGTDVGRLTAAQARLLLAERPKTLSSSVLELKIEDSLFAFPVEEIGIGADIEQAVKEAFSVGRSGNLFRQIGERLRLRKEGREIPLKMRVDEKTCHHFLSGLAVQVDQPARDGSFILGDGNQMVPVPESPGRRLAVDEAKSLIALAVDQGRERIELPLRTVVPTTVDDLKQRGIVDVIAHYSTWFNAADEGRTHNLLLGANALAGHLIEPGEVFSFNRVVGPRETEQGYLEAPVIIDDELVPGVGGGICQVSSTLYNAVLLAGLAPVERLNHSLASTYVPLGRDATVVYGLIDFKFKNTRPEPVMIGARVLGNELTMAIFGTKRGETVTIETEIEEAAPFPLVRVQDDTLEVGAVRIKQKGAPGYKVKVIRIIRKDGEISQQEIVSRDIYQPTPEIYRVGPVPIEPKAVLEPQPAMPATDLEPTEDESEEEVLRTDDE